MSKEEILKPYVWDGDATSDIVIERDALKAMEEYAKQVALAFYEHEEGVPKDEMESNFDFFYNNLCATISK